MPRVSHQPAVTEKSAFGQMRRNWASRLRAARHDRINLKNYGPQAPLFAERLWIPLDQVEHALKKWNSKESARVVAEWPDERVRKVRDLPSIKACLQHWREGMSWEETGVIDQMVERIRKNGKVDRLRNRADVERRYAQLDELYLQVRQAGRLSPRSELVPGNFREEGGILFHIGPGGEPYFGGKGHHRLAIALALGQAALPAQIGAVHSDALSALLSLRTNPPET
ncbi:MAG: hypothetical protein CL583_14095 [Alteromonadaceae bacterium]|mgnify:CR=1 FL=1|nr:hypothetical protein [Alteromonadaceae bacterium]